MKIKYEWSVLNIEIMKILEDDMLNDSEKFKLLTRTASIRKMIEKISYSKAREVDDVRWGEEDVVSIIHEALWKAMKNYDVAKGSFRSFFKIVLNHLLLDLIDRRKVGMPRKKGKGIDKKKGIRKRRYVKEVKIFSLDEQRIDKNGKSHRYADVLEDSKLDYEQDVLLKIDISRGFIYSKKPGEEEQQRRVVDLIRSNYNKKEIAEELGICYRSLMKIIGEIRKQNSHIIQ